MLSKTPAPLPPPIPSKYRIEEHGQICQCCRSIHKWTLCFAVSISPAKLGLGAPVTQLKPCSRPEWNLPIEHIRAPMTQIPFCHSCNSPSLGDLPTPPSSFQPRKMKDAAPAPKTSPVKHTAADLAALLRKS